MAVQTHLSDEELEKAVASGAARVIYERGSFRLVVHGGLKYHCTLVRYGLWSVAAGAHSSDYRGQKSEWKIKKVEPDTGYQRKTMPRPAITASELAAKLRDAMAASADGRWAREHWRLVSPDNIKVLLDEIDRLSVPKAA